MCVFATAVQADQFIQMPDGSTAWQTESGHIYGQSGGTSTINRAGTGAINPSTGEYLAPSGNGGYTGTRDGRYYAPAGPNGVIDTQTGRFIPTN